MSIKIVFSKNYFPIFPYFQWSHIDTFVC